MLSLGLLFYFRGYIGSLILAFVVTYLLHPVANWLTRVTHFSWRVNVALIYFALLLSLIALSTLLGVVIVQQVESLYGVVVKFIHDLPSLVEQLTNQQYFIGPFELDISRYLDVNFLVNQVIQLIQPVLGRTTSLVGSFAARAAAVVGLVLFILLVSYFLLAESGQMPNTLGNVQIPGYDADVRRMGRELTNIWNAFLRGQLLIMFMVMLTYVVVMSVLGVRFAIGIAILAGISRFVPYLGAFLVWVVTILAAFFQPQNYFNLLPLYYTILVIIFAVVVDQVFDSFITPQIMGQTLRVHPAAILVGVIIAASFMGFVGVVLAAPIMASLKLFGTYAFSKMFDLYPWMERDVPEVASSPNLFLRLYRRAQAWLYAKTRKR